MALLVLLMPTNYRAGTETSHPHAFFQEMIDLVVGHPHEHGDAIGGTTAHEHEDSAGGAHTHDDGKASGANTHTAGADAAVSTTSPMTAISSRASALDVPGVSELTPSVEKASAILILTMLLSAIALAGWKRRDLWTSVRVLREIAHLVEAPPPRAA